jgi:hypothetical protein
MKSGSLNLLEPSGPVQACNGIALPLPIEEEIQYRITLGNKAYHTDQFFFKSRLVSKKSNLKMQCCTIRPTVTHACKAWVLKETIENKLFVFGRKLLRRFFGPTKERNGTRRIKTNNELDELIRI